MLLGGNKKFISVINDLIFQKDMGNYSPLHKECRSRLKILHRSSKVLLAICDIKDEESAKTTHQVILDEINISNLITKAVDIYVNKIGGTPEMKYKYEYDM